MINRLRRTADRVARGSQPPAGTEREGERRQGAPTARERGALRRQLRRTRRLRGALLLELGSLVLEGRRRGDRDAGGLVPRKLAQVEAAEREVRGLFGALSARKTLAQAVEEGVARSCGYCEALMSSSSRHCPDCGAPVRRRAPEAS
jgi:hypothetical protein